MIKMYILAQKGMHLVPCSLVVSTPVVTEERYGPNGHEITYNYNGPSRISTENGTCVAVYSSEKKALKVIEQVKQEIILGRLKVFEMPLDEEVEE